MTKEQQKDYLILANSVDQFKKIEEVYNLFKQNFKFNSNNVMKFLVQENPFIKDIFSICPENRYGKINEIINLDSSLEGKIVQSGSGRWTIKIKDYIYAISEINQKYKEEKK